MARSQHPIEVESYRILRSKVDTVGLPPVTRAVTERVIHSSADLDYAVDLVCDEDALQAGRWALATGAPLVVDVRMLAAGITSRQCVVALDLAANPPAGLTRSAAGIRGAAAEHPEGAVWAVGNAPTALRELIRLAADGLLAPTLVIGLPVGFVDAVAAKAALRDSGLPALSNRSAKGGAAVAAAVVNALLYGEPGGVKPYLVGLDLAGRSVVVVGAGTVAQRRLPRLVAAGADVLLVAPAATPAVEAMAESGELRWEVRGYADGDLDGAWYVLACSSEPAVNAAVAAEAQRRRVFCVRADDATGGSAVTAAAAEHDGLLIGVLAGRRPRRSAAVRDALVEALRTGVVDDAPDAEDRVATPGVALVGAGPGDPDLITVRGRRLLARADVVLADRLAPRELLDELGAHVTVIDAAKVPYGRAMPQDQINAQLIEHATAGRFVVRLKGGDPYVFGRGFEEVLACAEAGVPVTVVPGVTSATSVPAAAGIPVTHRGVTHEFVVVSGHVAPDDPTSLVDWPALGRLRGTLVLLMAVERIEVFADVLITHGRPPDTPVAVIADGTLRSQRTVRSTLRDVAADVTSAGIRPPAIVVIGPVVALHS